MVYIKWQCPHCGDIVISNSFRHHQMDFCKKGCSGCDLEEYMIRWSFKDKMPVILDKYDYKFFDELVVCMEKQGFLKFIKIGDRLHLDYNDVYLIRDLEDKLIEELK